MAQIGHFGLLARSVLIEFAGLDGWAGMARFGPFPAFICVLGTDMVVLRI